MSEYLVVFPRGFIGKANAGLNKETNNITLADRIGALRYNKNDVEPSTEVYNLNVTEIYRAIMSHTVIRDKVTVIKSIIIEAFRNLGEDLVYFINLQRESRYFSRQHQDFILDTLKFIRTGKRCTTMRTWEIALKRKLISTQTSVYKHPSYDREVAEFFNSSGQDGKPITANMDRVIAQWLSHRNGHEDLIITLNLLFGKEFK